MIYVSCAPSRVAPRHLGQAAPPPTAPPPADISEQLEKIRVSSGAAATASVLTLLGVILISISQSTEGILQTLERRQKRKQSGKSRIIKP